MAAAVCKHVGARRVVITDINDERLELAPRDVVSKCIMQEQKAIGSDEFFLDISYMDSEFIKNRFRLVRGRFL